MARKINRLNARAVATITEYGRHADGGGLYLSISPNGGRRWVFLFRWHGKPTEIGFGSARGVTLERDLATVGQSREIPSHFNLASKTLHAGISIDHPSRCRFENPLDEEAGRFAPGAVNAPKSFVPVATFRHAKETAITLRC